MGRTFLRDCRSPARDELGPYSLEAQRTALAMLRALRLPSRRRFSACAALVLLGVAAQVDRVAAADGRWISPTPPWAHAYSSAIYDSLRYRMLAFGGNGAGLIN